jgi:hypothetical protein
MAPGRLLLCFGLLAAGTAALAGCHESDIEPQSPVSDEWAVREWSQPVVLMSQADVPPGLPRGDDGNPAPLPAEPPRSVSLGYISDAPLSQVQVPRRWPWVQEPFHMDRWSYGGGYGRYGGGGYYGYSRGFGRGRRY